MTTVIIYGCGFILMYFYSLQRDIECDLEQNKMEALWFALFWPLLVAVLITSIVIGKIADFVQTYLFKEE